MLQVSVPIKKAVAAHKDAVPAAVFSKAVKISRKVMQNILAKPGEEKFRRLPTAGKAALSKAFFDHATGGPLLESLGFRENTIPVAKSDEDKEEWLQFSKPPQITISETAFLNAALGVLRSIPIIQSQPRSKTPNPPIKTAKSSGTTPAPPRPASAATGPQAEEKKDDRSPAVPKSSGKKRKRSPKKPPRTFDKCKLSIRFPDGHTENKVYPSGEKLKTVWNLVSPQVKYPYFELKPLGMPKSITDDDKDKTLLELGLCPATKIVVQTVAGQRVGTVDARDVRRGYVDIEDLDYEQMLELEESLGKAKKQVVPQHHIAKVGRLFKWKESDAKGLDEDQRMCAVCRSAFEAGESLRELDCKHRFHEKCIDYWLTTCKNVCPECTQRVRPKGVSPPLEANANALAPVDEEKFDRDLVAALAASVETSVEHSREQRNPNPQTATLSIDPAPAQAATDPAPAQAATDPSAEMDMDVDFQTADVQAERRLSLE